MCDCLSYNRLEWGGTVPEIVVTVPAHLREPGRDTICLDLCIAPAVLAIWAAGVRTYGACCGHNGQAPRCIIVDHGAVEAARAALWPGETAEIWHWKDGGLHK